MSTKKKTRLAVYSNKRDFSKTPEPKAGLNKQSSRPSLFVVQKHEASRLHYDFRLEIDGVLKSWAIPKGPSADPTEKRLAISTEDHPLEYADFEGVIPQGQYGAGTVSVWDKGTYRNLNQHESLNEAIEKGHISFWLEGEKLKGGYTLIRTSKPKQWLLIKRQDDEANTNCNPVNI
jgi:DNA ligase D-like protein (predicted 3'-phosphoesterase)